MAADTAALRRYRLWSPVTNRSAVEQALHTSGLGIDRSRFNGTDGRASWCLSASSAGTYSRALSPQACGSLPCAQKGSLDNGTYRPIREFGGSALATAFEDTYGYVGAWDSTAGPAAGTNGTVILAVLLDSAPAPGGGGGLLRLAGFYCTWDAAARRRRDCFTQLYSLRGGPASCPAPQTAQEAAAAAEAEAAMQADLGLAEAGPGLAAGVCGGGGPQVCCSRVLSVSAGRWGVDFGRRASVASVRVWAAGAGGARAALAGDPADLDGLSVRLGADAGAATECALSPPAEQGLPAGSESAGDPAGEPGIGLTAVCRGSGRYLGVDLPGLSDLIDSDAVVVEVCLLPSLARGRTYVSLWFSSGSGGGGSTSSGGGGSSSGGGGSTSSSGGGSSGGDGGSSSSSGGSSSGDGGSSSSGCS